jgi:hypothetical protein
MQWILVVAMVVGAGNMSGAGGLGEAAKEHTMALVTRATPILHVQRVEPSISFWVERPIFRTRRTRSLASIRYTVVVMVV